MANQFGAVLPMNEGETIGVIDNPYLKGLLEQQRMILEIQKLLIEAISHPPMYISTDTREVKINV